MKLTIFSAHHTQPLFPAQQDIFVPFWAGGPRSDTGAYVYDELIPKKPTLGFNETSQQYYVWKHFAKDLDFIGFEHYRRVFLFGEEFIGNDEFKKVKYPIVHENNWHGFADFQTFSDIIKNRNMYDEQTLELFKSSINKYDVILPIPYKIMSLKDQWVLCGQNPTMLDILQKCIEASSDFREDPFPINFSESNTYFCNMFIMNRDLFCQYMHFWEQVVFGLEGSVDMKSRMVAFLSERLFSIFINHRIIRDSLRKAEVPFCLCPEMKVENEH